MQNSLPSLAPTTLSKDLENLFDDPHPKESDRVAQIYLNLPGMAKIYDCKRKQVGCFDHLSFSQRMSAGKNSAEEKGKQ